MKMSMSGSWIDVVLGVLFTRRHSCFLPLLLQLQISHEVISPVMPEYWLKHEMLNWQSGQSPLPPLEPFVSKYSDIIWKCAPDEITPKQWRFSVLPWHRGCHPRAITLWNWQTLQESGVTAPWASQSCFCWGCSESKSFCLLLKQCCSRVGRPSFCSLRVETPARRKSIKLWLTFQHDSLEWATQSGSPWMWRGGIWRWSAWLMNAFIDYLLICWCTRWVWPARQISVEQP